MSWNIKTPGEYINGPLTVNGSATVTGDLTVDTNTLKVDSANNRVGVGTASPAAPLNIGSAVSRHFLANGQTTGSSYGEITTTGGDAIYGVVDAAAGLFTGAIANASFFGTGNATSLQLVTNSISRAVIDSSGNLGLGVTPGTWGSTYRAFQIGAHSSFVGITNDTQTHLSTNARFDGTNWLYIATSPASRYNQADNVHKWFNAPSGTAGNAITFTQAMTLDASGRLLVGKTSGVNSIETVGAGVDGRGSVGGVSTAATTIYTVKQSSTAAMCVVFGDNGTDGFCDIVLFLATVAPKVVSSQTLYGSPAARTYSTSTTNLQLALASGTLAVRTAVLSTLNS